MALATAIRDRHFAFARDTVAGARDEAAAARRAVLLITLAALGIAVAVAWHLTRTVVGPVRRLTRGANAIREGNFSERIDVASRDELGDLAAAFNQMAEDLTEFRRTNIGEVVSAKHTLEATLEALPDAVVLLDGAGRVQSMNRAAFSALAAAGVSEPRCLDDLRLEGLDLSAITRAISTGAGVAPPADLTRTIRVEQDGAVQRLLPRVVPVPALNPQRAGAVLLLYDVTDIVRLDEMRSELVAVASHELQTPLTTLRMTLLMLQEASAVLPARQRELVATSLIGVEQLTEIVHEFLDLTRIEAGELRLNLEPVAVSAVIADALRRVEGQAAVQRVSLRASVAADLPPIPADPFRLRAVFDNILSNALKYTPAGGNVSIESVHEAAGTPGRERHNLDQRHRHWSRDPSFVSRADFRQVLPSRAPSGGRASWSARRGHRPVHVPADRRAARRRHLVQWRPRRARNLYHGQAAGEERERDACRIACDLRESVTLACGARRPSL